MNTSATHRFIGQVADPASGFGPFLRQLDSTLQFFYTQTQSTVLVESSDGGAVQARRVLSDAYIQHMNAQEAKTNACFEEQIVQGLDTFSIEKQPLAQQDEVEFRRQCIIETALLAQELVHGELNRLWGYTQMPYCRLMDAAQNFIPERWFTVLSKTSYTPGGLPPVQEEIEVFRKELFENMLLDDCFFESVVSPLLSRFRFHLLSVRDSLFIKPIHRLYGLPIELAKEATSEKLLQAVPQLERRILCMNALINTVGACRRLQSTHEVVQSDPIRQLESSSALEQEVVAQIDYTYQGVCTLLLFVQVSLKIDFSSEEIQHAKVLLNREAQEKSSGSSMLRVSVIHSNSLTDFPMPAPSTRTKSDQNASPRLCQRAELYKRLFSYEKVFNQTIKDFQPFMMPSYTAPFMQTVTLRNGS